MPFQFLIDVAPFVLSFNDRFPVFIPFKVMCPAEDLNRLGVILPETAGSAETACVGEFTFLAVLLAPDDLHPVRARRVHTSADIFPGQD